MKWARLFESGALLCVILAALASGLAAAYGRELEGRRRPDWHWWWRRLLLLPLLAITATAATDEFGLTTSTAAFTAAMLSLGGYDVLRLIEKRWNRKLEALAREAEHKVDGGADELLPRD